MPELGDPNFTLRFNDGRGVEVTRDNAALYTFFGGLSLYDHVYIEFPREGFEDLDLKAPEVVPEGSSLNEAMIAYRLFNSDPQYRELADFMLHNDYVLLLNLREVPDVDQEAYVEHSLRGFNDLLGGPPDSAG